MKKHFRKIPDFIMLKINEIKSDALIISTTLAIKENDVSADQFANLGIKLQEGELLLNKEFMPVPGTGRYSKKNALGFVKIRRDLPKVYRTIDCGDRPIFGDWTKGSFALFITKLVYQRERFAPKELTIGVELIDTQTIDNQKHFILKVSVNEILDKSSTDFLDRILFNLNLLQENIYKVDVFSSEANIDEYRRSFHVAWEIFPPGERETDINRILDGYRNQSDELRNQLKERYDFLRSLNPINFIYGLSGIRRYFGAQFSENLVAFDNMQYGNAIYILFENWRELSQLSRSEILDRPEEDYIWIKHSLQWKNRLKSEIEKRLN